MDEDRITVRTEDAKGTLEGRVDSLSESAAAVENAYKGGAVYVDNHLKVSPGA